jgi:MFS family permease
MKKVSWQKNLLLLWLSQLAVMSGFSAMIPFVPLFIKENFGITQTSELAYYVAMFNFFGTLGYAIFCPIWGVLADRFGVKPMLLRGTFVTSWMFPLMAYVPSAGWLVFLRLTTAACAGTTAASQVMIARNTPDHKQGFAQGVLTTAVWGGAMLGNVIGGFIIHYFSYSHAFWFCGILYVFAGIAVLFTQDDFTGQVRMPGRHVVRVKGILPFVPAFTRSVWLLLFLFLLMGTVRTIEAPYVALKIEAITGSADAAYWTGIVSAVACVGAILSGVVNGYLSDKLSPLKMLVPLLLCSAAALYLQGCANNLFLFSASRALLYISAGGLPPILQKQLSAMTPKRKRGSVFGFSSAFNSSGGMIAALIGGWCFSHISLNGVFYVAASVFALSVFIFYNGLKKALLLSKRTAGVK